MRTRRQGTAPLAAKLADVWIATPHVMAIRLSRMAAAGHQPSEKDRAEMQRMVQEKLSAASQSWIAMWMSWWLMPLRLAAPLVQTFGGGSRSRSRLQSAAARAWTDSLVAGVAPVRSTVLANAKRLARDARTHRR